MGVDTRLYLNVNIRAEFIAYAVARAAGIDIPLVKEEPNVFSASKYLEAQSHSPASYWHIIVDENSFRYSLHLTHESPLGVSWVLTSRSKEDVISVYRTVGEALGGFLVWQDCDDLGQMFQAPEYQDFVALTHIVYNIQPALVTPADIEHAAYSTVREIYDLLSQ